MATNLRLQKADLQRIYEQAQAEYPDECCGVLTATPAGYYQVHPCVNMQDQMHARDPESYPRTARTAYFIDPLVLSEIERGGNDIAGFYHSHIDVDAYFSQEDKERAFWGDEPIYADAVHLVLSVVEGQMRGYKCFIWNADEGDFIAIEIELAD